MSEYCDIDDIRDEGITVAMYSDARVLSAIKIASALIESYTGRWFEPRTMTIRVQAKNTKVCYLPHPIISITQINVVTGRGSNISRDEISVDDVLVFNRHLTMGITDPDDRDIPRIAFEGLLGVEYPGRNDAVFPWGSQVIEVVGRFGYTELGDDDPGETFDGSQVPDSEGSTPLLIAHACKLMTIKELPVMSDTGSRGERERHRIISEKTADQSYNLSPLGSRQEGALTGDPEVDAILVKYLQPISIGTV
jgi:hypothetical protein